MVYRFLLCQGSLDSCTDRSGNGYLHLWLSGEGILWEFLRWFLNELYMNIHLKVIQQFHQTYCSFHMICQYNSSYKVYPLSAKEHLNHLYNCMVFSLNSIFFQYHPWSDTLQQPSTLHSFLRNTLKKYILDMNCYSGDT